MSPLQILVVGQEGIGKSSLVNALSEQVLAAVDVVPTNDKFTTHELSRENVPLIHLTDSPSLDDSAKRVDEVLSKARQVDAIIWVVSAVRPDRAIDVRTYEQFRSDLSRRPDLRPPPIVILLSNADRVRPFSEWQPPYDLTDSTDPKSRSINEAISAVADDFNVEAVDVIPVAMAQGREPYNIELVWARLMDLSDDARNVQLLRRVSDGAPIPITKMLWRQAIGAGRVIRKTMFD